MCIRDSSECGWEVTKLQATREMWFTGRMRSAMDKKPSPEHSKLYGYQRLRGLGVKKKKKLGVKDKVYLSWGCIMYSTVMLLLFTCIICNQFVIFVGNNVLLGEKSTNI